MGFFRSNSAEKKLKSIVGGFLLKDSFVIQLTEYNLTAEDGYKIKKEIQEKIKKENLKEDQIEDTLNQLIKKYSDEKTPKINREDSERAKRNRKAEQYTLERKRFEKATYVPTVSINKRIYRNKQTNLQDKIISSEIKVKVENKELQELENLYNKKLNTKYDTDFKYAYVIFLNQLVKNPTKKFNKYYGKKYNTNFEKLKKRGEKDKYIKKGTYKNSVNGAKIKELKEILKENNLKVTGNKKDLINRVLTEIPEEVLKKRFPSNSFEVTEKGLEFINKNKHALIYNKYEIKNTLSPKEFNNLVVKNKKYKDNPSEETIYDILIEYYTEKEKEYNSIKWFEYRDSLSILESIYNAKNLSEKQLEYKFKLFLFYLNRYIQQYNKGFIKDTPFNPSFLKTLTSLINKLNYPIEKLKEIYNIAYTSTESQNLMSEEDSLIILLKIFNETPLEDITEEINEKYT